MVKNFRTKANAEKYQRSLRKKGSQSRRTKTKSGYKVTKTRELMVSHDQLGGRTKALNKARRRKGVKKSRSRGSTAFRLFG